MFNAERERDAIISQTQFNNENTRKCKKRKRKKQKNNCLKRASRGRIISGNHVNKQAVSKRDCWLKIM